MSANAAAQTGEVLTDSVVVTAQKRERGAFDTPIALNVIHPSSLAPGFGQTSSLEWLAPGLTYTPGSQPQSATFSLRGVATFAVSDALDRSVGVVWDDIGQAGSLGENSDLVDIDRVEIARGPQSTLFGESATAGIIHVVSAKPVFEREGRVRIGYGSDNEQRYEAMINLAAGAGSIANGDTALRLVAWRSLRDGIISAPNQPRDLSDKDDAGWRARLRWQGATSEANLIVEGLDRDAAGFNATHRLYQGFSFSSALQARDLANGVVAGPDNFASAADGASADKLSRKAVTARFDHHAGDLTLTSISGWRLARGFNAFDPDYTDGIAPAPSIYRYDLTTRTEQLSQEIRLAGPADAALDYVFGVSAQSITTDSLQKQAALRLAPVPLARNVEQHLAKTHIAAFADLSFAATDTLRLLAALRYGYHEGSGSFSRQIPVGGFVVPLGPFSNYATKAEFDYSAWDWKLGGEHQIPTGGLAYATVNRAHKSPAFNFTADTSAAQQLAAPIIVGAERVLSYEAGYKQRFGDRAELSLALFNAHYDDFQGTTSLPTTPLSFIIINVNEMRTRGVELETNVRIGETLTFASALSYTDAEFSSFPNAPCYAGQTAAQGCRTTPAGAIYDVSGTVPPNAPRWAAHVSAQYRYAGPAYGRSAEIQLSYKDGVQFGLGDPNLTHPAVTLVNASLGFEWRAAGVRTSLHARNLFDETFAARLASNNGAIIQFFPPEARRSFAITVEKTF